MNCDNIRDLIGPYMDEELDAERNADVQSHLETCGDCAGMRDALTHIRNSVHADAPYYAAPLGLEQKIRAQLRAEARPRRRIEWALAAAIAAAALLVWGLILLRPRESAQELLAHEVVSDHIRSLLPGHLIDVPSTDQHTVKPWFAGKVDFAPTVKDLSAQGFMLRGGRIDYLNGRTVAAIVYQRRQHWINLFVWPHASTADRQPKASALNGYNIVRWTKDGFEYWAVSDVAVQDLRTFASLY